MVCCARFFTRTFSAEVAAFAVLFDPGTCWSIGGISLKHLPWLQRPQVAPAVGRTALETPPRDSALTLGWLQ